VFQRKEERGICFKGKRLAKPFRKGRTNIEDEMEMNRADKCFGKGRGRSWNSSSQENMKLKRVLAIKQERKTVRLRTPDGTGGIKGGMQTKQKGRALRSLFLR